MADGGRKSILITGSSGFVGRNLVEHLSPRYHVVSPRHKDLDLTSQTDVDQLFRQHSFDYIVHCANVGGNRKAEYDPKTVEKNIRMFLNLQRHEDDVKRMLHFGSGAEYDKSRPLNRIPEEELGQRIPQDDYGFSKYVISKAIAGSRDIYCLRLFGVFGPYEDYEYKFISNAMVKNLLGMDINIRQNVFFSWLYVKDLLSITESFLTAKLHHKDYNIVPDRTYDLVTIVGLINGVSRTPSEFAVENPGLNLEYSGSNERLREVLPNFRFTEMREAVGQLYQYYQSNLGALNLEAVRKDEYAAKCSVKK